MSIRQLQPPVSQPESPRQLRTTWPIDAHWSKSAITIPLGGSTDQMVPSS